jgi:hypothetical protein
VKHEIIRGVYGNDGEFAEGEVVGITVVIKCK